MNFTMEYYLLKYEELSVLSDTKKCRTSLMRNKDTGEIVVKKEMGKESFSVYSLLKRDRKSTRLNSSHRT